MVDGAGGVRLEGVTASYGDTVAIKDVSLYAEPGETVAVIGPSGCGKSTLLRAVAGLQSLDSGRVRIGGRDVSRSAPAARGVGFVPQSYALFPHMNVAGNVGYGLRARRVPARERARRIAEVLRFTSLDDLAERRPEQLSGGQRQRVALARALAVAPAALLLDEPLAALDPQLRSGLRRELSRLLAQIECATLLVTHDQREALTLGHRIALLRDGRVVQFGTASELWNDPFDAFVADFLGSSALLEARLDDGEVALLGGAWRVRRSEFTEAATAYGTPRVLLRGDALRMVAPTEDPAGTVAAQCEHREFLGDDAQVTVRVAGVDLAFRVPAEVCVPDSLRVGIVPGKARLLLPR